MENRDIFSEKSRPVSVYLLPSTLRNQAEVIKRRGKKYIIQEIYGTLASSPRLRFTEESRERLLNFPSKVFVSPFVGSEQAGLGVTLRSTRDRAVERILGKQSYSRPPIVDPGVIDVNYFLNKELAPILREIADTREATKVDEILRRWKREVRYSGSFDYLFDSKLRLKWAKHQGGRVLTGRGFDITNIRELAKTNPIIDALINLSEAVYERGVTPGQELIENQKALQNLIYSHLKAIYKYTPGEMSYEEHWRRALEGMRSLFGDKLNEDLFNPNVPPSLLPKRARDLTNLLFSKEFISNRWDNYSILDEMIGALTFREGMSIREVFSESQESTLQLIKKLMDEAGLNVKTAITDAHLAEAMEALHPFIWQSETGDILWDRRVGEVLRSFKNRRYGRLVLGREELVGGRGEVVTRRQYYQGRLVGDQREEWVTESIDDMYRWMRGHELNRYWRDLEQFERYTGNIQRNLTGKFGTNESLVKKLARLNARPRVIFGEETLKEYIGKRFLFGGREFEILNYGMEGVQRFRVRSVNIIPGLAIQVDNLDSLFRSMDRTDMTVSRELADQVATRTLDAENIVEKVTRKNVRQEIAERIANATVGWRKSSLKQAQDFAQRIYNLDIIQAFSSQYESYLGVRMSWLLRDVIQEHLPWTISRLTRFYPGRDVQEIVEETGQNLMLAATKVINDMFETGRIKLSGEDARRFFGSSLLSLIERGLIQPNVVQEVFRNVSKEEIMRRIANEYLDIHFGQSPKELLASTFRELMESIGRSGEYTANDVAEAILLLEHTGENAILREAFGPLWRLYRSDPVAFREIVENIGLIESPTSLNAVVRPTYGDDIFAPKSELPQLQDILIDRTTSLGASPEEVVQARGLIRDKTLGRMVIPDIAAQRRRMFEEARSALFKRLAYGRLGIAASVNEIFDERADSFKYIVRPGRRLSKKEREVYRQALKEVEGEYSSRARQYLEADVINLMAEARENRTLEKVGRERLEQYRRRLPPISYAEVTEEGKLLLYSDSQDFYKQMAAEQDLTGGAVRLVLNGRQVIYNPTINEWYEVGWDNRLRVLPFTGTPIELELPVEVVVNRMAKPIVRAQNDARIVANMNISSYLSRSSKFGSYVRDIELTKRIFEEGSKFWVYDIETTGLPEEAIGALRHEPLQIALRRFMIEGGQVKMLSGGMVVNLRPSVAMRGKIQSTLGEYLGADIVERFTAGTFTEQDVLAVRNLIDSLLSGDKKSRDVGQFLQNTIGKFPRVLTEGFGRSRTDRYIAQTLSEIISIGEPILAHNAPGMEIPLTKEFFDIDLPEEQVIDTLRLAQVAYPGGALGGFSLERIAQYEKLGDIVHYAGEDVAKLARAYAILGRKALERARDWQELVPGQYVYKFRGPSRGGMVFLGSEITEKLGPEKRFLMHFKRLDTGRVYTYSAPSAAALQHQFNAQFQLVGGLEEALVGDIARREDAVRYTISHIMQDPRKAMEFDMQMQFLRKLAAERGVSLQELSYSDLEELEGAAAEIAETINWNRFVTLIDAEGWYNNVWQTQRGFFSRLDAARRLGYLTDKDVWKISDIYYTRFRESLGDVLRDTRMALPWERSLEVVFGGKTYRISLASIADTERTLSNLANILTKKSGRGTNEYGRLIEDAYQEIANQLRERYGINVEGPITQVSLAEALRTQASVQQITLDNIHALGREQAEGAHAAAQEAAEKEFLALLDQKAGEKQLLDINRLAKVYDLPLEEQRSYIDEVLRTRAFVGPIGEAGKKASAVIDDAGVKIATDVAENLVEKPPETLLNRAKVWFSKNIADSKKLSDIKGVGIALGLIGAGYLLTNFLRNDPMPMDKQPQHDQAPSPDGTFIPAGTGQRTIHVTPSDSGYQVRQGVHIDVSARGAMDVDQLTIASLLREAAYSTMPVDYRIHIQSTDNTNKLDDNWYRERLARAISR